MTGQGPIRGIGAVLLLSLLVVGAMLSAGSAKSRPLDDITADGTIRIAVYRDFPPFSYVRDGELAGVDVDIGRAIAEVLNLEVDYMLVTPGESVDDDLRNAVWKGHYIDRIVADLMLRVPVDRLFALRNKNVAVVGSYSRMTYVMASDPARDDDPSNTATSRDTIGVELAPLPDYYLSTARGGQFRENVQRYPTIGEAAEALRSGAVASVAATRTELDAALGPDAPHFAFVPLAMAGFGRSSWLVGAAVDEHSRDLGYAAEDILAAMVANGTIAAIFVAFGLTYDPPEGD